jgi:hypothetical protein
MKHFVIWAVKKQSQSKPKWNGIGFFYNTEDCRGPSGLAMTFVFMLFLCFFVAMNQFERTKPI